MEEATPRISVILVDGSFRDHFHMISFLGSQTWTTDDYEVIWVEYYDCVKPELRQEIERFPNMRVITLNRSGPYHSSYCFNAGIVAARAELVVIPDADLAVESDFLQRIWSEHQSNPKLVMYLYRYMEPAKLHVVDWTLEHLRVVSRLTNPSNYGGCLTVRKEWLQAINGYEQHSVFGVHDHANGLDIYTRLKIYGLHVMWHPDIKVYHPWHIRPAYDPEIYKPQFVVIDYRAKNLNELAYEGINPEMNQPFPEQLIALT